MSKGLFHTGGFVGGKSISSPIIPTFPNHAAMQAAIQRVINPGFGVPRRLLGKEIDFVIIDEASNFPNRPTKFAPVAPARIYRSFVENGYIPKQVLLLAHDVVKNLKEYEEVFRRTEWLDTNIIMDNSLVELGKAADANMVHEAAECVCADLVVLPDVMGDGPKSCDATIDAWPEWYWKFRNYGKMILIHGASLKEWLASAERMKHLEPDWIGIPRITEDVIGVNEWVHRGDLADWAQKLYPNCKIHLFGFSEHPHWDILSASQSNVESIDSAVPLRLESDMIFAEDAGKRGDWWDNCFFEPQMIKNCRLVDKYINS